VEGLNNQEVEIRQKNFGPNELKEVKQDSPLKLFLSQFTDVLIFLLIIASIASYFIGDYLDSAAILAVVAINSVIGFRQEYQAEQAMEKLKSLVSTTAIVKRENKILKVDARELTIGDIVLLEEGNKVPADLILIESHDLKIDESSLTGESLPVKKNCKYSNIENFDEKIGNIKEYSRDDDIHEKLAYMDSNVVSGRGTAVVIDVGMNTSIGKIATLLQEKEEETPLSKKVDRLGKMIGAIAIVVCIGVFFIDYYQGMNIVQTFMTAVSLAVAAIPEGLPAVLTLTLAIGMQKMARSNAIVRKLLSVETLGSCTVICTDKTGTLTKNKMTVRESSLSNKEMSVLISGACNNAVIENEEYLEFLESLHPNAYDILYGSVSDVPTDAFENISVETKSYMSEKWTKLGATITKDKGNESVYVLFAVIVVLLLALFGINTFKKIRRERESNL
jgi:Ca2+-transporting ATPase